MGVHVSRKHACSNSAHRSRCNSVLRKPGQGEKKVLRGINPQECPRESIGNLRVVHFSHVPPPRVYDKCAALRGTVAKRRVCLSLKIGR